MNFGTRRAAIRPSREFRQGFSSTVICDGNLPTKMPTPKDCGMQLTVCGMREVGRWELEDKSLGAAGAAPHRNFALVTESFIPARFRCRAGCRLI
jgi:hypothetical protein